MPFSRLLLGLISSAAASTFAAPASPGCDLSSLITKLERHCQSDPDVPSFLLSPTAQCCEELVASLPAEQEAALPCLCRAADDSRLVTASLDANRLFALYRGKGKGKFGRDPDFGNWYCEGIHAVPLNNIPHCSSALFPLVFLGPGREFLIGSICLVLISGEDRGQGDGDVPPGNPCHPGVTVLRDRQAY